MKEGVDCDKVARRGNLFNPRHHLVPPTKFFWNFAGPGRWSPSPRYRLGRNLCGGVLRGLFMALEVCLTHTPCSGRHRGTTSRFQKPCALKSSRLPRSHIPQVCERGNWIRFEKNPPQNKKTPLEISGKNNGRVFTNQT